MRRKLFILFAFIVGIIMMVQPILGQTCPTADPTDPVGIVPTYIAGNTPPTSPTNVKVTPGNGAETIVYNLDGIPGNDVTIVITLGGCGEVMSWSVPDNIVIDHVYAKGGNEYNDYNYTGVNPRPTYDGNLHCPTGPSGKYPSFSHMNFVFHYKLTVSKTAATEYTRTFNWTIEKSVTPDTWNLFKGDDGTSQYTVSVDKTGYTDSDWAVSGTITIANNTPFDAVIESITDKVDGIDIVPDCGVTFPYTLSAGNSFACSYSSSLPDGSTRKNRVTVITSGIVGGDKDSANVIFGNPTSEVNTEVTVEDFYNGSTTTTLGTVSDDYTWTFERTFSEEGTFPNVATIKETGQSDDASVTVKIYELKVRKAGKTSFKRTYNWTIDKSADQTDLVLSSGQTLVVNYSVEVNATPTESDWVVFDTVVVKNLAPVDAAIDTVSDVIYPVPMPVVRDSIIATCDFGEIKFLPYILKSNESLKVIFSANLPDAATRTDTARAFLVNYSYKHDGTKKVNGDTTTFFGTATVDFSTTEPELVDECIDVNDTYAGALGEVCIANGVPKTFNYTRAIGPYTDCGKYNVENTASFVTKDQNATASDPWNITVNVPCAGGCTLTQGYWKTHSSYGPAPYDDTWEKLLPNAEGTPFFLSNQTWYQVLWTQPKGGNVYYILAHQYVAAQLNFLNGADPSAAQTAFNSATTLFKTYTPDQAAGLKGSAKNTWTNLATILDDYNNGLIGPGHCDEDDNTGTSSGIKLNDASGQSTEKGKDKSLEKIENDDTEASKDESKKQPVELNNESDKSVLDVVKEIPRDYELMQNHPNPFNPSTTISFSLPIDTKATLTIYNISGQKVATLVSDYLSAGYHSYQWNIPNNLPAGIYFYRLETAGFASTRQMVFLK